MALGGPWLSSLLCSIFNPFLDGLILPPPVLIHWAGLHEDWQKGAPGGRLVLPSLSICTPLLTPCLVCLHPGKAAL